MAKLKSGGYAFYRRPTSEYVRFVVIEDLDDNTGFVRLTDGEMRRVPIDDLQPIGQRTAACCRLLNGCGWEIFDQNTMAALRVAVKELHEL